jgi:uncharacterized protein YjbI with pentapeptide repeats
VLTTGKAAGPQDEARSEGRPRGRPAVLGDRCPSGVRRRSERHPFGYASVTKRPICGASSGAPRAGAQIGGTPTLAQPWAVGVGQQPMQKRTTSDSAIWACAVLGTLLVWATALLFARLQPYWVARYRNKGADLRGAALPLAPLRGTQFDQTNLQGANLRGADLRSTWLERTNLAGADLRAANLEGAAASPSVVGANLSRARMRGVFLYGVDLKNVDMSGADLSGATFTKASFESVNLRNASLRCADVTHADLRGAVLRGADLRGSFYDSHTRWPAGFAPQPGGMIYLGPAADLRRAELAGRELWFPNLRGAELTRADLQRTIVRGDLPGADLARADLRGAHFAASDLRGADLRGADLRGATFVYVDLWRTNLSGAKLSGVSSNKDTVWPSGADPWARGAVRRP